jgi:hypothetical protein
MHIAIVKIKTLLPHERHRPARARQLAGEIHKDGRLRRPLLADRKTYVLLDGHHRLAALKSLGCKKARVLLVDYQSKAVRLYPRKKNLSVNKRQVVTCGLRHRLYPVKSTRHLVAGGRKTIKTPLQELY